MTFFLQKFKTFEESESTSHPRDRHLTLARGWARGGGGAAAAALIVEDGDESGASTRRPPRLGRTTRVATRFDSEEGGTIFSLFFLCACIWSVSGERCGRSLWQCFGGD